MEEQSVTTRDIADNVGQASTGVQEVNENVAQADTVIHDIAKDVAKVNEAAGAISVTAEAVQSSSLPPGLLATLAGNLDAIVLGRYTMKLKGEEKFAVLTDNFGDEEYGVGLRKDVALKEAIDATMNDMHEDGTYDEIYAKWFAE